MELDEVQKQILIGCLKYEKSLFIPALAQRGVTCLSNVLPVGNGRNDEYCQVDNHWVAGLVGKYLVKAGNDTYKFTESGLKLAHELQDAVHAANTEK